MVKNLATSITSEKFLKILINTQTLRNNNNIKRKNWEFDNNPDLKKQQYLKHKTAPKLYRHNCNSAETNFHFKKKKEIRKKNVAPPYEKSPFRTYVVQHVRLLPMKKSPSQALVVQPENLTSDQLAAAGEPLSGMYCYLMLQVQLDPKHPPWIN